MCPGVNMYLRFNRKMLVDAVDVMLGSRKQAATCLLSQPVDSSKTGQLHCNCAGLGHVTSRPADNPSAKKKEGSRDDTMPKSNSRRLDKDEKNVLLHLLQAPKLTNCDIAR